MDRVFVVWNLVLLEMLVLGGYSNFVVRCRDWFFYWKELLSVFVMVGFGENVLVVWGEERNEVECRCYGVSLRYL